MSNKNNNLKLGIFVVSGLFLLILGTYYMGKMQNMFQSNLAIYTDFQDVKGLKTGNSVRYMGINAGSVREIIILNDSIVRVEMGIDKEVGKYIRKNAHVEINNDGVMGSKILVIYPGSEEKRFIKENDQLEAFNSVNTEDILDELENTTSITKDAAENILEITKKINSGTGDMATLLNNNHLTKSINELTTDIRSITSKTKILLEKANGGNNDLSALLNKKTMTNKLNQTLTNADTVSENLKLVTNEILIASESLNQGNGALSLLLHDSIFKNKVDTTVNKINKSIDEVTKASEAIKRSWLVNIFSGNKKKNQ